MGEITFLVQGSAVEPYVVRFTKNGSNLTAHCTCPAGVIGQYCKHRFRILKGDNEGIVSGNQEQVKEVASWLSGTDVETALHDVRSAEERLEAAKREFAVFKKKLARALMN
ncbi:MAG: hypothetical protein PHQ04_09650 [Opitutaceae bacterium]|nr:hypothetical protein [Opitutaceae bacterium]